MRPTCFEVFLAFSMVMPALLVLLLLRGGGWRPGSPLWEPMLICLAALGVILMLLATLAWSWSRRR